MGMGQGFIAFILLFQLVALHRATALGSTYSAQASPLSSSESDKYNGLRWRTGDTGNWFEWWYYKVVLPDSMENGQATPGESFFFTYGVTNPGDDREVRPGTKSFVSFGRFKTGELISNPFSVHHFSATKGRADVHIGLNWASRDELTGSLVDSDGGLIAWDLKMNQDWRFNAMGWGMYVPGLSDIYWYPAQASARMSGWINFKGREILVHNAPAYQDRNWGRSFPKWWTWIVSNHFEGSPGTSLAVGVGRPKVFGLAYLASGLAIGLKHDGEVYKFRTTDGQQVKFNINFGTWEVQAIN